VTGKLVPGLEADLAAFEGNLLEDLKKFEKLVLLMAWGRECKLTPIAPALADEETARITGDTLLEKKSGVPVERSECSISLGQYGSIRKCIKNYQ
jgi:hypothetical protein